MKFHFLHDILHFVRQAGKTAPQETAQTRAQLRQERVIGRAVAARPEDQQIPEAVFACAHGTSFRYSLFRGVLLHRSGEELRPERIVPDMQPSANALRTALQTARPGQSRFGRAAGIPTSCQGCLMNTPIPRALARFQGAFARALLSAWLR